MKVLFPSGTAIQPGFVEFKTLRLEEEEVWWMGHLIETKVHEIHESHGVIVPDPGVDETIVEDGDFMPLRGQFTFGDKTFEVIRDDDWGFWGWFQSGEPRTKEDWLGQVKLQAREGIKRGEKIGWWDIDSNGDPQRKADRISIADMQAQNKTLMAHLMVDLGFFPSVAQARKNGWDKPLELGRHELGPRKKRAIVEIVE
jgi:hypothetical protein